MSDRQADDGSKKVKNIAAVLYLLMMIFLVGGSYINQHRADAGPSASAGEATP